MGKGLQRQAAAAPKQLPAPENLGEGFEVVPREEALRRISETIRAKVQTGTSGPKGIPPEPPPAAPVKKALSVRKAFTPQENLDEAGKLTEAEALKFFEDKQDDALKAYQDRVKKEFGTDRVISGDEAKFIVPGVKSETMAAVHEPASAFAKIYGDELLRNPLTKDKPAMIMAGGSGSGKTRSIRSALDLDGYAAVFDTNSNNLAAAERNIAKIRKTGRPVEIVYVERDPVEAWQSVISRGKRTGRPVPADIHIKNQGSRETVKELVKIYKADPDVKVRVLLNKEGEPIKEVPLATFLKKKYTSISGEKLKGKLHEVLEEKIKSGQLTEEEALPYRFREEKPSSGQGLVKSVAEYPEGLRPENNPAGKSRPGSTPKALTPKQKLLNEIEDAKANQAASAASSPEVSFQVGKTQFKIKNTQEALQGFQDKITRGIKWKPEYKKERYHPPEIRTMIPAWRNQKLDDQLGFARVKKNLAGMTEEQQRAEISRLRDKALAAGQKERKFIKTVRSAPKTKEEVAQKILGTYKPITNKQTLDLAKARIEKSVDEAVGYVKNTRAPTAESNATAQLLIDRFQNEGNYNAAIDIVEDIAAKATKQGQAIQALSMYSKLTPEGVLKYAQRQFDKATEELVGKARLTEDEISKLPKGIQKKVRALKLTPQLGQKLTAQAKAVQGSGTPRQRAINTARLLKQVQQQIPVDAWDKIAFTQTLMQLLNPKTAIRNVVGNAGFTVLENISDTVAAAFDRAVSLATGQRSKVLPNIRVQMRGAAKGARQAVSDINAGIRTYPGNTQFQLPQTGIFKSRVGQSLEKVLRYELEVADRAGFTAAYRGSLINQMKAAGVKRYTPEMVERAVQDGLYRTFQDDNVISEAFSRIKRSLNKLSSKVTGTERFGLGDAVIKYPKTPGAILDRGIDYSPAGFFNTVFELTKPLTGKPFNQKAFVESAARAFTGSSLVGTGIILAKLGLITGRKDDKPGIRDLKRQIGLGNYKINISGLKRFVLSGFDPDEAQLKKGDRLETYDWFQPQAIAIAIGANIEENKGKVQGVVGTIAEAIGSGTTTLAEQPLVSGISRMFGYGDVVEGLGETLKGVPASFTPTLLNQIRLVVDDIRRNPDADDPSQESMNLVKMKVPGLASSLPAKTEPLGGTARIFKNKEGVGERAFNAFLNPSNSSRYGTDPATREAEELIKYDVPVGKQSKTLKGIDITAAERAAIDRLTGPIAKSLLQAVISRPEYQKADPLAKQKMLEALVQKSKTVSQTANVPAIARRLVGKKNAA